MRDPNKADAGEIMETFDQGCRHLSQAATKFAWCRDQLSGTLWQHLFFGRIGRLFRGVNRRHRQAEEMLSEMREKVDQHAQDTMHP